MKPPEGAYTRIHQPPLPQLKTELVQAIVNDGITKNSLHNRLSNQRPPQPRIVPMGTHLASIQEGRPVVYNTARRLEVLRHCINCIFENKITDARKCFKAVLGGFKQRDARLTLCKELARIVHGNKAMLEQQQFDLIIK